MVNAAESETSTVRRIHFAVSDVGRQRQENEDSLVCDEELGLYAVADGMGGHEGGAEASRLATTLLRDELHFVGDLVTAGQALRADDERRTSPLRAISPEEAARIRAMRRTAPLVAPSDASAVAAVLNASVRTVSRAIYDRARASSPGSGMGTTLTAALFHGERLELAHVGDSRGYLLRAGKLEQLTRDHSWIAEQVDAGLLTKEQALESPFRHVITRSLGFERDVVADSLSLVVSPGDCVLLCSDGLSNAVSDEEIARILAATWYRRVPQLLVDLANDRGGDDNVTVVLIYVANDS